MDKQKVLEELWKLYNEFNVEDGFDNNFFNQDIQEKIKGSIDKINNM